MTSFFREPARFEALKTVVFPAVFRNRGAQDSVRLWVAGCSTGEEVYSLGIALLEFLADRPDAPRISIYGTDINEQSLRKARAAFYSEHAVSGVTAERLAKFFTPAPGGYKIAKELRDLCVFAAHDVTRDPPYSRIDLVTCCNVLIYFDLELQKKALALVQYGLARMWAARNDDKKKIPRKAFSTNMRGALEHHADKTAANLKVSLPSI